MEIGAPHSDDTASPGQYQMLKGNLEISRKVLLMARTKAGSVLYLGTCPTGIAAWPVVSTAGWAYKILK